MKKFLILFCMLFAFNVYAETTTDNIDPELLNLVDELNGEDYLSEIEYINDTYDKIFAIDNSTLGIDFSKYKTSLKYNESEIEGLSLSEKIKLQQQKSKIRDEAFMDLWNYSYKNNSDYQKIMKLVLEVVQHETKLYGIFNKMTKFSSDINSVTLSLLEETKQSLDNANFKLNLAETNVRLLNEALAYQERKNKRAYIAGNIIIPVVGGLAIFTSGMLVVNSDENSLISQKLATDLLYASIFTTVGCEIVWNGGHLIFKWW